MRILALLALLQISAAPRTAGKSHGVIHDSILDGVTFQDYGHSSAEGTPAPAGSLVLDPPALDFGTRPLGEAHAERVTLFNRSNSTLRLASISGSTHNFHASFFDSKVVPPHGNTSFSVVFLGRREGAVDSHLYLHTSIGSHKYAVSGVGAMSEYRLSPLVGVKLPRNVSFSPTIYMHNPHPYPIQIMEVYSSGGGVTLELPSGGTEGPQSLWLLPAHTTRPVVRVHYTPPHPHPPHTALVRIKLNGTNTVLVVPVDVGVERDAGPYVRPHMVDAGLGGTGDPPTQIPLSVGNSGGGWVRLRGAAGRGGDAVEVELERHSLPPFSPPARVATLTVHWDRMYESGVNTGEVRLTTSDQCLTVPYQAHPLPGALVYNATALSFVTSAPDVMMPRVFSVRNDFTIPVHVTDVEVAEDVRKHFVLTGFSVRSLPSGESADIFSFRLREFNASLSLVSHVTLVTNVTSYKIDVLLYSGRLEPEWDWPNADATSLDLGVVPTSSTTRVSAGVVNNNPLPVCVSSWGADMEGAALQFRCGDHNVTCWCMNWRQHGLIQLSVVAPAREGVVRGRLWLQTDHERIETAVTLRAARGKLVAERLVFANCFPGTSCIARLKLESTLSFPLKLLNVTADPPDSRLYHRVDDESQWEIPAESVSRNGRVHFAASVRCRPYCYTGLRFNSTSHLESWLNRPSADDDWLASDLATFNARWNLFEEMSGKVAVHNFTLRLHTSEVYNRLVPAEVHYTWPRLSKPHGPAAAGLVGVGTHGDLNVTLVNPSTEESVYVHVVQATVPLAKLPRHLHTVAWSNTWVWSPQSFRIARVHLNNATAIQDGGSPSFLLPPRAAVVLQITFTPHSAVKHSALLLLRNNLTILETVQLIGHGAHPSLKFGNRKPGSGTPLLFELTEKHLKDCERDRSRLSVPPNLTVKRSFTARNTGDIPITISTFYINGFQCEGYGFKVLNCEGFKLNPNSTHKVDIAFTPDFTLSKIKRTLILMSSLNSPVNYSLVTTVPAHLLAPCSAALTRPPWETYVRNVVVSFMICIGLCVLAAGFMESDRILKMAMAAMSRNAPVQPPLDLRNINKQYEWSEEKPKAKIWTEDRRFSEEKMSKYEEVPHKSKKKLAKKCSHEPTLTDLPPEKEVVKETRKEDWREKETFPRAVDESPDKSDKSEDGNSTPSSETRDTAPLVPSETQSERKILDLPNKILASLTDTSNKKRNTKQERRQNRCEEDASSTATESSNNDELEKEIDVPRVQTERNTSKKSSPANSKKKCPAQYKDSYEGDGEDEEYDRPSKPNTPQTFTHKRNKDSNTPTPTKQTKIAPQTEPAEKPKTEVKTESPAQETVTVKPKVVAHKPAPTKKEKVAKKKIEKLQPVRTETPSTAQSSRNSPPAASVPTSCWGENRATFSDVVSRSDNNFSTVTAPKKSEKLDFKPKETPLAFVKKDKAPLGPIGSNFIQKRSPTRSDDDSLYANPIRQIADPTVKFEDLVPQDNNNSFFYFGTDNVRSQEVVPREVGVIGKPSGVFPTPIGQNYGQVRYSPSVLEGARTVGDGRMEFDRAWDQRNVSPGMMPPTTSQSSAFGQNVYSGEGSYNHLWDTPSGAGAVGQAPGPAGDPGQSAQWLWGYNSVRPPPGFPPQQQPIGRTYDPFTSISSIFSPKTLEAWSRVNPDDTKQ